MSSQYCFSWVKEILNKIRGCDDETSIVLKKQPLLQPPNPIPIVNKHKHPLIIRYFCPRNLKLYIIDGYKEKECKPRGLNAAFENPAFVATCDGLILLSSTVGETTRFATLDPLCSGEKGNANAISIIERTPFHQTPTPQACAFFFHPLEKEHRILAVGGRDERGQYEYQIYSFGTKLWRKTKTPYFRLRPRCYWKSESSVEANAMVVNDALHWYEGANSTIMVFDVVTEEFDERVLPFEDYLKKLHYFEGYLSKKGDEELRFCVVGRREAAMEVWGLEDYGRWSWCRKFRVDLDWDLVEFPVVEPFVIASYHIVRVVGFDEDEVMLFWRHRGLFVYNVRLRRVERVWSKKLELPQHCRPLYYDLYCGFSLLL